VNAYWGHWFDLNDLRGKAGSSAVADPKRGKSKPSKEAKHDKKKEPPAPSKLPPKTRACGDAGDACRAAKLYAYQQERQLWGSDKSQWHCLDVLWIIESGWQLNATNKGSGAYGIPQSLPASKMASAGSDWRTNYKTQIRWGIGYIHNRYHTPCAALTFHR